MILVILMFIVVMLSTSKDDYQFAFKRGRNKKLPSNGEYEEVVSRYIRGKG